MPQHGPDDARARQGSGAVVTDPLPGRLLDRRYRIGPRVARGGMAAVYEAVDVRLERTVAVKVMHAGLGDDEEFAARFVREARAAARLSHPNVVSVFDQGNDDGTVYLAMELVSGHTLRDTIAKESPMAPARAMALMEPVLSALAAAHRAGLIHRDVKPENVLIADDGRIKVADFGLAKAVSADTQHTATQGVLIGTVSYLAPELVVDGRADARADVYAAGVMLYELLTGTKPHEGESPIQVAYKHVHHDVPPPSALAPGLPAYVDALVARATARDRDLRPADASVLLHQLHRVSHALADGVREDPELTQDLAPVLVAGAPPYTAPGPARRPGDTAPEMWDEAEMAALLGPAPDGREHTTRIPETPETPARRPAPPMPPARPTDPPADPPAARPATSSRPRRSRRGPLLLVLALVLALAIGGGAFWFGWARYVAAPSVLGLDQAAAETSLQGAGLDVAYTDPAHDSDVPEGQVVSADPAGGSQVLPGDTVTLTVSLGKLLIPEVRGLGVDRAQDALLDSQLEFGELVERYSGKLPEGSVLTSLPRAGKEASSGDPVDLVVSLGRRPIEVGSWVGEDGDEAVQALEERRLVPIVTTRFDADVPRGDVISQDPADGTLFRGGIVSLLVSRGPELVPVPSVRVATVGTATERLEDAGFVVEVVTTDGYLGLDIAVRTDPGSGEMAPKGSVITLYVV